MGESPGPVAAATFDAECVGGRSGVVDYEARTAEAVEVEGAGGEEEAGNVGYVARLGDMRGFQAGEGVDGINA